MITNEPYGAEPWSLTESSLNLDMLAQSESVFALSNGHIGLRGNLDEGEPNGLPGTYLNSVYEDRPLPYAEAGYGFPDTGQTVINITNGKIIRLLVDDEPFDIRYGTAPRAHPHPRPAGRHPDQERHLDVARRAHRQGQLRPARLADPARDRRVLLHGHAGRRAAPPGADVGAGRQRGHPGRRGRPPRRRRPRQAPGQRGAHGRGRREARGPSSCTAPGRAGSGWPPR